MSKFKKYFGTFSIYILIHYYCFPAASQISYHSLTIQSTIHPVKEGSDYTLLHATNIKILLCSSLFIHFRWEECHFNRFSAWDNLSTFPLWQDRWRKVKVIWLTPPNIPINSIRHSPILKILCCVHRICRLILLLLPAIIEDFRTMSSSTCLIPYDGQVL